MSDTIERSAPVSEPQTRSLLRRVAVPTEHGGWGLTAEPVVLGLAVAPSVAGLCLGVAAIVAFLARSPLRVLLVDRHRGRHLERTNVALVVLIAELAVLLALVAGAVASASAVFLWPALVAAPLVGVELWFDMRSRSRRLVPELAGTIGICSVVAMIILAAGRPAGLAVAAWLILAGRAVTALPHVRAQIAKLHQRSTSARTLVVADAAALVFAALAVSIDTSVAAGALAVVAVVVGQRVTARRPAPAKVVGIRQTVLGLAVVAVTAIGIHLT